MIHKLNLQPNYVGHTEPSESSDVIRSHGVLLTGQRAKAETLTGSNGLGSEPRGKKHISKILESVLFFLNDVSESTELA